ncbi:MAG: VapC toxin family PIN domain ribonuclease [Chloroflexi bacterium]|nr:VapC toxin family PIN domain ribonuclease [Chloroflexota bacterium]MDL1941222.1 type II toxin-antitoxin system VapC family toxin [Chloroflexi bacterium CFX2]
MSGGKIAIMSEEKFLLDTSAVLTLIEDEPGANRVKQIFSQKNVLLPWVVLMEIYYMTLYEKGGEEAEIRFAMLRHSTAEIVWEMNEVVTLRAAKIKSGNKLSFSDAVIASIAVHHGAVLVHKDPEYEQLKDELQLEALPYK